jgi:predicted RNA binding protein YcfA (HicA-like mRNA interferase family)
MDSRTIIKKLKQDGWYKVDQDGSHVQFRHPSKKGRVTVPHPRKDFPIDTLKSIERQSGLIPRKATTCDLSLALNINSCVAQACNSLLSRTFAPCS